MNNMSISLVIPLAGEGSRFKNNGWNIPKPFIPIQGKTMINRVLESFDQAIQHKFIDRIVLIVRSPMLHEFSCELREISEKYATTEVGFIEAKALTQGAACSVLLTREKLQGESLLIADCDTSYEQNAIYRMCQRISTEKPNIAVSCFTSDSDRFSYIDNTTFPPTVAEKRVISHNALSGLYYFSSADDFFSETIKAMIYNDRDKGEFYISKILGNLANDKKQGVMLIHFDKDEIHCYGTPEQLSFELNRLNTKS
jgi:UDP-N-acetylglucosamine diphosphorylase / glucose-1-phosphate thymidylyltransferase / UDP-N-acetylgalactosamine diphosphorylase / glucosamine-1-phosphate N-acetyltransferase / galactosamine-1-phosphate N-acetyltransferase